MADGKGPDSIAIDVIQLWRLPDNFFSLLTDEQWAALKSVTVKATPRDGPRRPCRLTFLDDMIAVAFFLVTLGLPCVLLVSSAISVWSESFLFIAAIGTAAAVLALHPPPERNWRKSRLSLALMRYFTMEVILDRSNPILADLATSRVDDPEFQERLFPLICLACPHGVFNYGAIIWCCVSRWFVGREQCTGAADVVRYVPGLRYMDQLIRVVNADRKSIQRVLRGDSPLSSDNDERIKRSKMLGMVPDGILGAFRCKNGVDELVLGKKRGLVRIAAEEGAMIISGWFFGTTDIFTVVQDPFGLMEWVSRKLRAGILGFYGRWYLPIPRRIAITMTCAPYQCKKNQESLTKSQVEQLHNDVYGRLVAVYEQQKTYAGYPDRSLQIS